MRIIESRSIDNQAGLLGSRLITGTNAIEGAFQSFIVAEDTVVTKVYNSIGIDVTGRLGLTSITLKAGAFISMPKGDYFSSIKLASGSIVAYFTSHGGMSISADAYLSEFLSRTGSSYLEASECVKAHLQQLINIGLLQKASLIMSPSMYEEDLVKSVVPQDGSGDLTFTRASDGTRINSAGLVEVCPWNFIQQSNAFSTGPWAAARTTLTSGQTDPNGGSNAWKVELAGGGNAYLGQFGIGQIGVVTISAYFKADSTTTIGFNDGSAFANSITIGTTWQRYEFSYTVTSGQCNMQIDNYFGVSPSGQAKTFYIYGAQLNIGSTAKPYFPTTDRLNVPRLTYQNGGGGCPSLLLEPQRTNLALYSDQFDNAYWGKYLATISTNNAIAPDGTQSAELLYPSSTGSITGQIYRVISSGISSGNSVTTSVFVKASGKNYAYLSVIQNSFTPGAYYNLTTGAITNITAGASATITQYTNGWWRITLTSTAGAGPYNITVGSTDSDSSTINTVSGTNGILIWGFQVEASSYPTSYIPTTSSSATRVADECKKSGIGALIGGTSGTVFFDIKTNPVLSSANYKQFCYYVTSGGSQSYLYLDGANKITTNASWGSLFYNTALQPNTRYKVALVFAPNDFALYINGVSVATASSGTPNNNVDLQIGQFNGTEMCEFVFNQYTHFPTRLTNSELASLTTI